MDWTEGMITKDEIAILKEKIIPIESVTNFRQLGGYVTQDGRKIKNGLFYRCGALGEINDKDYEYLKSLGIRFILDLRSEPEMKILPDPIIPGANYKRLSGMHYSDGTECDFSPKAIERLEEEAKRSVDAGFIKNFFNQLYQIIPFNNEAYREMFKQMMNGEVPILFHCTAGKDRTGVAAMLIMLALGVDETTILKDYMFTNICRDKIIKKGLDEKTKGKKITQEVEAEIVQAYGVSLDVAKQVLKVIHEKYTDLKDYFKEEYGLDENDIKYLREEYLE